MPPAWPRSRRTSCARPSRSPHRRAARRRRAGCAGACHPRASAGSPDSSVRRSRRGTRPPSVRLTAPPLPRRCTIHVLCPFARTRRPSPGAALSHGTASRPSTGMKERTRASVKFVLFVMVRSLLHPSVATGGRGRSPCQKTPRTRRGTGPGSELGRVRTAALRRRAGCKSLTGSGFRRFADGPEGCDSRRPSARSCHTPAPEIRPGSRVTRRLTRVIDRRIVCSESGTGIRGREVSPCDGRSGLPCS